MVETVGGVIALSPRGIKVEGDDWRVMSRNWVVVIPGHDDGDLQKVLQCGVKKCVFARETGETGYKHWQGYVEFDKPRRATSWQHWMTKGYVAVRTHTQMAAVTYCRKGGDVVRDDFPSYEQKQAVAAKKKEAGEVEAEVVKRLQRGQSIREIHRDHPVYVYRNHGMMAKYQKLLRYMKDVEENPDEEYDAAMANNFV